MDKVTNDLYVYENTSILRNLLNIQDQKALEIAEAEISSAILCYSMKMDSLEDNKPVPHKYRADINDVGQWRQQHE